MRQNGPGYDNRVTTCQSHLEGGNINIPVEAAATTETCIFLVFFYCFFDEGYVL